jgi:pyrimidine-specific ribonucleoside hydrolase
VGAFDLGHKAKGSCVSAWHYRSFGEIPPSRDAVPGPELLNKLCGPTTTLVTDAPLKNLGALARPGFHDVPDLRPQR